MVFTCLQALAWLDAENGQVRRAAVVMGAADAHRRLVGSNPVFFPNLLVHQNDYEETVREALAKTLDAAHREGASMTTAARSLTRSVNSPASRCRTRPVRSGRC
ncbi:hypothetical protein GS883_21425 [Rhodococcus hoagii]|nr:hypothetical protein [Prescottella equi]